MKALLSALEANLMDKNIYLYLPDDRIVLQAKLLKFGKHHMRIQTYHE